MVIDAHGHLGDILYPGGGELIWQKGVVKAKVVDPQDINEKLLMRNFGIGKFLYTLSKRQATIGQRARNATATLENFTRSLDQSGVDAAVCLPIAPHVTFEDLAGAQSFDSRIIAFTSVDFSSGDSPWLKLPKDVSRGACGLKLHPIIQKVPLTDRRTLETLQTWAPFNKPVLAHAGIAKYYLDGESDRNRPELGALDQVEEIVRTFPRMPFIVGHAGLFHVNETIRRLCNLPNVWVDTSFQSPGIIRKLIAAFGPEKVLYASDWPWGNREPHIRSVKAACRGDRALEDLIFRVNAAGLLKLET